MVSSLLHGSKLLPPGSKLARLPLQWSYGARSLGEWRRALYGRRSVEVVEKCLVSGLRAVAEVRRARDKAFAVPSNADLPGSAPLREHLRQERGKRIDTAWKYYSDFAGRYLVAQQYVPTERDLSVELSECLNELSASANLIELYERSEDGRPSPDLIAARTSFFGQDTSGKPDDVERRLGDVALDIPRHNG